MISNLSNQIIFYGPPGTGKSHSIQNIIKEKFKISENNVFRTAFHPDYDYSDFVGTYRPMMETLENKEDRLNYKFIPGILLRAYVKACIQEESVVLVIDEINRGNCSAIFGDFFQLLDRSAETGRSSYSIHAPLDVGAYLQKALSSELNNNDMKLTFPENFYLFATMNTSDQSVFPIDSAFIRRWSWRYKGIDYKDAENFYIKVGEAHYSWATFLKEINEKIYFITESEDKQLGNRFIMPSGNSKVIIHTDDFVEKVLFYLWNEIYKDENTSDDAYIFKYISYVNQIEEEHELTFSKLFNENRNGILKGFMQYNGIPVENIEEYELEKEEVQIGEVFTNYKNFTENDVPEDTMLHISCAGISASGLYKSEEGLNRKKHKILVLSGSQMISNVKKGMPEGTNVIRDQLISNGIVEKIEDHYVFVKDYLFNTLSEAAAIIGGTRLTGPAMWKTESGLSFNNLLGK